MSINELFYEAISVAAGTTKVSYPNIEFDKSVISEYYQVICLPQTKFGIGCASFNRQNGFCQVSCYIENNNSEEKAIDMAEVIISAFPRGTRLESGDIRVNIDQPAYYTGGITTSDGWFFVPVTIPFNVLT